MKQRQLCTIAIMLAAVALAVPQDAFGQAPAAADTAAPAPVKLGAAELQTLVAPIALYPDALLAHVLPASTAGMDVVAAARFLRKNNGKAEPKPDAKWNTSVFVLLQFPDVLYRMDENLEWTDNLGKAVLAQQAEVMKAIQDVRTTAMANGALRSNDKQQVVIQKDTVTIVPADPTVVYVPTYNPSVVVVNQTSPNYTAAAATVGFAAGVTVGALLANDHCDWHGGYVAHGRYPVPYGTYARPAAAPYNPRGVADPRGRFDPRGVADPRGIADPRGALDPRGARDPRGVADPRGAGGVGRAGVGGQAGLGGGAAGAAGVGGGPAGVGRAGPGGQAGIGGGAAGAAGVGRGAAGVGRQGAGGQAGIGGGAAGAAGAGRGPTRSSSGGSFGNMSSGARTSSASSRGRSSMGGGGRGGRGGGRR